MNILEGRISVETRNSKFNGPLTVVKDIFYGTYIMGGGLPQSGGLAEIIWKNTLNKVKKDKIKVKNCLILGLGGGGIAKIVRKNWPKSNIVGVDIDPVMVDLGKKYLKLEEQKIEIIIQDVNDFVKKHSAKGRPASGWDLVCVDTYQGDQFPKEFATQEFAEKIKSLLSKNGTAIFNRLYGSEDRKLANDHGRILEKVFKEVNINYPEANIMFICKP